MINGEASDDEAASCLSGESSHFIVAVSKTVVVIYGIARSSSGWVTTRLSSSQQNDKILFRLYFIMN